MVPYRRNFVPGGTFFFTLALRDRKQAWLIEHADLLRQAFDITRKRSPFHIDAIVVLPDHLHTIWTLPPGNYDYSGRWQLLKSRFTRALAARAVAVSQNARGEYHVWQRRFWEHTIRDERDYQRHVDYVHYNPVKHGYVAAVRDWRYSSFHRYVAAGLLPLDWAGNVADADGQNFGE